MGCGESKIKKINLTPDINEANIVSSKVANGSPIAASADSINDESVILPNRLLSAIPVSDLGDSLDSRHLNESLNMSQTLGGGFIPTRNNKDRTRSGGDSIDSGDSGYDEYDEEYNYIITENSSQELVSQVEAEFRPADLPELLVITGRACVRILSGYQKTKAEEGRILDTLREEGLLAKPKGKTAGGVSFEVVDSNVAEAKLQQEDQKEDIFVSASFIPQKMLDKLESRRGVSNIDIPIVFCQNNTTSISNSVVAPFNLMCK